MGFNFFGTRFYFSFGFFVVLSLYMLFDRTGVGVPALAAVAVHEGGHMLAMRCAGVRACRMDFQPFGVRLHQRGLVGYGQELLIYAGGVTANALALAVCLPWGGWGMFAPANLALIVFNLLPVGRLDGGQLLRVLLLRRCTPDTAARVRRWVGIVLLAPLFGLGVLFAVDGNWTLLATAAYLAATLAPE